MRLDVVDLVSKTLRMVRLAGALAGVSLLLALGGCERGDPRTEQPLAVSAVLGSTSSEGFQRAERVREFDFPRDHGAHPGFRNEWWYLTGNLTATDGHPFGYQLTLFRIALSAREPADDSNWRGRQLFMGHLAISDIGNGSHLRRERFSRAAIGLAGSSSDPFRVWLEDWSLQGTGTDLFPLRVSAQDDDDGFQLLLDTDAGPVLQGDRGLSRKSAGGDNASYYYSYTRIATQGTLTIDGQDHRVEGRSWLDHEWSTSALSRDASGWDWFALQLDDGRDLMFYRFRVCPADQPVWGQGVLVQADGSYTKLDLEQVQATPLSYWRSPDSGNRYPVNWRLKSSQGDLDLEIRARIPNQEMALSVHYWEGAVEVSGSHSGQGYLEMTRYPPECDPSA